VLVLVALLTLLLSSLRSASTTITELADRLGGLEERTGELQRELHEVDAGLGDVVAALREHRSDADAPVAPEHET
jgi:hypothetical protein